jgi:hypothetical protein
LSPLFFSLLKKIITDYISKIGAPSNVAFNEMKRCINTSFAPVLFEEACPGRGMSKRERERHSILAYPSLAKQARAKIIVALFQMLLSKEWSFI